MSKAVIRILLYFMSVTAAIAQEGNYPITHFDAANELAEFYPHQMVQDRHGMVFMAYNRGIIRFDGNRWEPIHTPTSVFALAYYGGKIYTGGPTGFGLLERGSEQTWEFSSLHEADSNAGITNMVVHNGRLIGLMENAIAILDLKKKQYHKIAVQTGQLPVGISVFRDQVYVTCNNGSPLRLSGDTLAASAALPGNPEFLVKAPSTDTYLGGSARGDLGVFRKAYSKIHWKDADNEDLQYIRESEITGAAWVSDTLVALSSLKGGIIFIQPFKGKITRIVNASSGLPDNEIFGMLVDRNASVWVAHEKGLSRISPYLPYRTFDQFPGLEGSILSIKRHRGQMYVGTTEGLFLLKRVEHVINVPVKDAANASDGDNRGFWNRIWPFRKKSSPTKKFRRELQSVDHFFEKVRGIESKLFHLATCNSKLVASGLDGLFLIDGGKATRLTSLPVRYVHYSPWRDLLYLSSYDGEVFAMSVAAGSTPRKVIRQQGEPVSYIFEDEKGNMYFCGIHTLFRLGNGHSWETTEYLHIQNPYYENTFGYSSNDTISFLHKNSGSRSAGMVAAAGENRIELPAMDIRDVIPGENGTIWVLQNNQWNKLGEEGSVQVIPDLSIFKNATYISDDREKNGMWIITGERNLFFLEDQQDFRWAYPHSAFLYEVNAGGVLLRPDEEIIIEQEAGNVRFKFSQAEYTHLMDMQYQYFVEGLSEDWSDWSEDHREIDFSYLPAGSYTLHFRSRNSLGQMENLAPVYFKVLAPYWKRPWFYLVEFAIIGLMLLISVRMKAMGYKYRFMSRLLALLTLIVIIELIQILAESKFETQTSPVVDFVIQVIIAIIILPVEEILRKYIFKDKHVKVSDLLALRQAQRRRRRQLALKTVPEDSVE